MRFLKTFGALFILCLLSASTFLHAQGLVLPRLITFTGAPDYTQAELLAFTNLKPGTSSTVGDIQSAAQRLNDTGLFADVHFESNAKGLVFALKPMPASNMLPVQFANFVWWSPQELDTTLKSRVPLYLGAVPIAGNLQDSVSTALKAMLAEKGVTATIAAIPKADQGATPTAIVFAIDSPQVNVHMLTFASASPAMQLKLDKVIKDSVGQPFDQNTETALASKVQNLYRNDGYLDAAIVSLTHSTPQITPQAINLDLTATLHEGEPYRLSQFIWQGSEVMSTADFNKSVKLKPEDIASQLAVRQSLGALAHAYYSKGYQDAKIQAPATLDAATHHVTYTIHVIPGEQYRIHSIKTVGLTDQQKKDFDAAWRMNPGSFYDVDYLTTFLTKNTAIQSLLGYSATYKAYSDPNTHLVDLVLTFAKGGTLVEVH